MSNALAIAGVTAALRDLLNDGLINHNVSGMLGSTVSVSVLPPDRVVPSNGTEASQLNLFLHQVSPNPGWRNEGLPAVDDSGRQRVGNPPLALNLHYLLSAYGSADLHSEILLGYAMQLLHENPTISRQSLRRALSPSPDVGAVLSPALRALADCGLADQIEQLRITPEYLNTEEMSKLWTATQSHYRPTAAYQVTVVLIEPSRPARAPLPVLTRGAVDPETNRDRGVAVDPSLVPPVPTLEAVVPFGSQAVVRLGETIDLLGHHLNGTERKALLRNDRFNVEVHLPSVGPSELRRQAAMLQFVVPTARAADFPVGVYQVSVLVTRSRETEPLETHTVETNRLAFALAPQLTNLPLTATRDGAGTARFTIDFVPMLRKGQTVSLLLGQQEVSPEPYTGPVGSLSFVVPEAPLGSHLTRLRIDGIESPIVDRSVTPPVFFNSRIEIS